MKSHLLTFYKGGNASQPLILSARLSRSFWKPAGYSLVTGLMGLALCAPSEAQTFSGISASAKASLPAGWGFGATVATLRKIGTTSSISVDSGGTVLLSRAGNPIGYESRLVPAGGASSLGTLVRESEEKAALPGGWVSSVAATAQRSTAKAEDLLGEPGAISMVSSGKAVFAATGNSTSDQPKAARSGVTFSLGTSVRALGEKASSPGGWGFAVTATTLRRTVVPAEGAFDSKALISVDPGGTMLLVESRLAPTGATPSLAAPASEPAALGALILTEDSTIHLARLDNGDTPVLSDPGLNVPIEEMGKASQSASLNQGRALLDDGADVQEIGLGRFNTTSGFATQDQQVSFGQSGQFDVVPVPEPATIFGALGLLGFAGFRERRRVAGVLARLVPQTPT